ncbi:hypothetical protein MHBO_002716 [Bonamia ostreae]|uniref:E3 ubiquitin protein ligase n=1 Tax=Bonamia ostreae TaxID=126728 RepID=A0ABV2ANA4_9EUKA
MQKSESKIKDLKLKNEKLNLEMASILNKEKESNKKIDMTNKDEIKNYSSSDICNMKIELEHYKKKVFCVVFNLREKNTIIGNCLHVFCNVCVNKTVSSRLRKCPVCQKAFNLEACREIYL